MANVNRFNDTFYLSFQDLDSQEIDSVSVTLRKDIALSVKK